MAAPHLPLVRGFELSVFQKAALADLLQLPHEVGVYVHGAQRSGKRSLVRKLAALCDKKVRFMKLSSVADSSDLFGNYDQLSREGRAQFE